MQLSDNMSTNMPMLYFILLYKLVIASSLGVETTLLSGPMVSEGAGAKELA